MNNISLLLGTNNTTNTPRDLATNSSDGDFADTFNRQLKQLDSERQAARSSDAERSRQQRSEAKPEEKRAKESSAEQEDGTTTAAQAEEAAATPSRDDAKAEAEPADGEGEAAVTEAEEGAVAEQADQVAAEALLALLAKRGEGLPAEGKALPQQGALDQMLSGQQLARELKLRLLPTGNAAEQPLATGEEGSEGAAEDQALPFERLLAEVRLNRFSASVSQPNQPNADAAAKQARLATAEGKLQEELVATAAATREATTQQANSAATPAPAAVTAATTSPTTTTSATPPPTQLSVQVPVNRPGWDEAFAQRVSWMSRQGVQEAQIQLNPRELGPVEVRISMQQDHAHVSFVATHPATRDALEQALPRLRDMLGDVGIQLADSEVSDNPYSERDPSAAGGEGGGERGRWGDESGEMGETGVVTTTIAVGGGGLDYYA